MFANVKNEIMRHKMLKIYTEAKNRYCSSINQLYYMYFLSQGLGKKGSDIQKKSYEAINGCKNCIMRFDMIINSLKERDYNYLKEKTVYISEITKEFETLTKTIEAEIEELKNHQKAELTN